MIFSYFISCSQKQVYGNIKEQLAGIEKQGTDRSENLVSGFLIFYP